MTTHYSLSRLRAGFALGFLVLLVGAGVPVSAHAAGDALIEGGRLCTQQFPLQEQKYNIPTHLLAAISTTESGRWHKQLGMAVPWPWTINAEGKGYHFASKAEAIAQTQNLLAQGMRSIDVGCMQVNLKHHSKAFRNLEEAFDPETNVAYAAKFLRNNYADLGDWIKATAAYHSRTQVYGQRYLTQIERSWNRIVAKVAAARASQASGGRSSAATTPTQPTTRTAAPRSTVRSVSPRSERVIKVTDAPRQRNPEILVIRGATSAPATPLVAEEKPLPASVPAPAEATPIATPSGDYVRRVTLDNSPPAPQPVTQNTPNKFVFAN